MHEMDKFNKIVYQHPHDLLESHEIFIRFSKNSLLICCVAMCENGNEIAEDTQERALSDQT
jgi:hypothetical protein